MIRIRRSNFVARWILALNFPLIWFVATIEMMPALIQWLPGTGLVYLRCVRTTPAKYGVFNTGIEQDADNLKAHWEATGKDRTPYNLRLRIGNSCN